MHEGIFDETHGERYRLSMSHLVEVVEGVIPETMKTTTTMTTMMVLLWCERGSSRLG